MDYNKAIKIVNDLLRRDAGPDELLKAAERMERRASGLHDLSVIGVARALRVVAADKAGLERPRFPRSGGMHYSPEPSPRILEAFGLG